MLSKQELKNIRLLAQKKYRKLHKRFIVEGEKMVEELLKSNYKIHRIYALSSWKEKNPTVDCQILTSQELSQCSQLKSPNEVLAVVDLSSELLSVKGDIILCLDGINDPGNLGTIVRTAAWFNVKQIICSKECADIYGFKAAQSTMGALFKLDVAYVDLPDWIQQFKIENSNTQIIGAELNGRALSTFSWPQKNVLVLGSESHGVSQEVQGLLDDSVTIPGGGTESLNVAIAGGIILASAFSA